MKVIGQAIARELGQYPVNPTGACALIEPGQVFDVYEGPGLPAWADEVVPRQAQADEVVPSEPARRAKAPKAHKVLSASDIA